MEGNRSSKPAASAAAGPSIPKAPFPRPATLAKSHEAHSSLRVQSAKQKQKQKQQNQGKASHPLQGNETVKKAGEDKGHESDKTKGKGKQKDGGGGAGGDREVTKVVLSSPLHPTWPNIAPRHQTTILQTLLASFPGLSEYHLARERASRIKRKKAKSIAIVTKKVEDALKAAGDAAVGEGIGAHGEGSTLQPAAGGQKRDHLDMSEEGGDLLRPVKRPRLQPPAANSVNEEQPTGSNSNNTSASDPPPPLQLLDNLLIGINEVIKRMEKQIARLRTDIWEKGDTEATTSLGLQADGDGNLLPSNLIPTAAAVTRDEPDDSESDEDMEPPPNVPSTPLPTASKNTASKHSPLLQGPQKNLKVIFVCHSDINPRELVDPFPLLAMSWNSTVRQFRGAVTKGKSAKLLKDKESASTEATEEEKDPEEVLLVTLPRGAELALARAMGLRRVAVFGVTADFPGLEGLIPQFAAAKLKPLLPPFHLHAKANSAAHFPLNPPFAHTHLKAISTTAPVDTKARKKARFDAVMLSREQKKQAKEDERVRRKKEGVMINGRLVGGTDKAKKPRQGQKACGRGKRQGSGNNGENGRNGEGFMQRQKAAKKKASETAGGGTRTDDTAEV